MDVPALVDDNMEHDDDEEVIDDEEEDIGWDEGDDEVGEGNEDLLLGPVKCLFCESVLNSAREVFSHCVSHHSFNVLSFCGRWSLDCIGYIKLINFIRSQHPTPEALSQLHPGHGVSSCPWSEDSFMKPVDPEDLLLQFDIELEDCSAGEVMVVGGASKASGAGPDGETASEMVTMKASDLQALLKQMSEVEAKAAALEANLERAVCDLNIVRKRAQDLMGLGGDCPREDHRRRHRNNHVAADENEIDSAPTSSVEQLSLAEDESYFSGYGNVDIHAEMLQDKVRTEGYRDFILGNPQVFEGKTVLDVGCGSGILSMFTAKAGAGLVIGVDQSDIIYSAMDIARENGLEGKITFLKGRMDRVQLPCDKVDIIISEWMGYFLLFESMLDTVICARNKYLADGGKVYPDKCSMWLAGICDDALRARAVDFWNDVYGFKMSCLKAEVMTQTAVEVIGDGKMITSPCLIKEFDVNTCTLPDVNFKSSFSMTCQRDGTLHGFVGYFDIGFEAGCSKQVHFSTGPASTSTHWKQTLFLLKKSITVSKGQVLEGSIKVNKNADDPRSLDIRIAVDGVSQKYIMD
ncbi:protein arginine N-methyltransferase 3-like isoform X2 [Babylonia areolata]